MEKHLFKIGLVVLFAPAAIALVSRFSSAAPVNNYDSDLGHGSGVNVVLSRDAYDECSIQTMEG